MYLVIQDDENKRCFVTKLRSVGDGTLDTNDVRFVDEFVRELNDILLFDDWYFDNKRIRDLTVGNIFAVLRTKHVLDSILVGAETSIGGDLASILAIWGLWDVLGRGSIMTTYDVDSVVNKCKKDGYKIVRW